MADAPYAGIRIVEFSTMVTCSLATMMFAQQGAEVVKVEPTGIGDPMRLLGSQKGGISTIFHNCNRGKRSLAVDLKTEAGQAAARALALQADILIHNYRPGVMERLGLGSDALRAANPRLIYIAVTGFGTEGPMAGAPAYDHVVQAFAGFTAVQGGRDDRVFFRSLVCDKTTAYTAAQAAGAALYQRERTGEGQHIDISMLDAGLAFLWPDGMMDETALDEDALSMPPLSEYFRTLKVRDGHIAFAAMSDEHWAVVFDVLDRPDLKSDTRFSDVITRSIHAGELFEAVSARPIDKTKDEIISALAAHDVPCAPCLGLDELPAHPQVQAIGALETQHHPAMGRLRSPAAPAKFGGDRLASAGPSPALGAHTDELLAELGYDAGAIEALRRDGVI
ncbi:MAG: CoA transferase [Pseudomonadota bacterium]